MRYCAQSIVVFVITVVRRNAALEDLCMACRAYARELQMRWSVCSDQDRVQVPHVTRLCAELMWSLKVSEYSERAGAIHWVRRGSVLLANCELSNAILSSLCFRHCFSATTHHRLLAWAADLAITVVVVIACTVKEWM
jgi:hypothetical protein